MEFTKNDLLFDNYIWTAADGDNPDYRKKHDGIKVNKKEGYEVLYFCKAFLTKYNKESTKENFQRVEKMLHHKDLSDIDLRSELNSRISNRWSIEVLNDIFKKYP